MDNLVFEFSPEDLPYSRKDIWEFLLSDQELRDTITEAVVNRYFEFEQLLEDDGEDDEDIDESGDDNGQID